MYTDATRRFGLYASYTHTYTHIHTHTHTETQREREIERHPHPHTHALTHIHARTRTHTHTHAPHAPHGSKMSSTVSKETCSSVRSKETYYSVRRDLVSHGSKMSCQWRRILCMHTHSHTHTLSLSLSHTHRAQKCHHSGGGLYGDGMLASLRRCFLMVCSV